MPQCFHEHGAFLYPDNKKHLITNYKCLKTVSRVIWLPYLQLVGLSSCSISWKIGILQDFL